eukprot:TRINITY_DN852_c0_g1_i1.p1 TRINITY_DN852_c0_g1~~TRINITY_DN852_c0_g1_i1.p1  ORF type:complete len:268 (-),score=61.53 TRINITY_DN852_c0_g1_i1:527-1330(-)
MMGSRVVLLCLAVAVCVSFVGAQDSAVVIVRASGSSQSDYAVSQAVSEAIAKIEDACKKGQDKYAAAQTGATAVVVAAAKAKASGSVFTQTTGAGVGTGSAKVVAVARAEAVAKAIATAIGSVTGKTVASSQVQAMVVAAKEAVAAIDIQAASAGDATAFVNALAESNALAVAVARALSAAVAVCKEGEPAAAVETIAEADEIDVESPTTAVIETGAEVKDDGVAIADGISIAKLVDSGEGSGFFSQFKDSSFGSILSGFGNIFGDN